MTAANREPMNRTTGPTPLPPEVRTAISWPIVSHRSATFRQAFGRVSERMQAIVGTRGTPIFLTCSGTGGLEAALLNTLRRDDRVLAVTNGFYGDLFADIARRHLGDRVATCSAPPGQPVDRCALVHALRGGRWDAVLLTHSESSTGVMNPLADLVACVHEHSDALVLVDAISSIGTTRFAMDELGVDVAITVPQKALMAPPGLAIVFAGDRALARAGDCIGSFYFDFGRALAAGRDRQTPSTPGLTAFFGLDAALELIMEEGIDRVYARHAQLAERCRDAARAAGLLPFAAPSYEATGITAVHVPDGMSAADIQHDLEAKHNLLTTPGLGSWRDRVLRIGHMGWVGEHDIAEVARALREYFTGRTAAGRA